MTHHSGNIDLRVVRADLTQSLNLVNIESPFCIIKSGESTFRTKPVKDGQNPIWEQEFHIDSSDAQDVVVQLWGHDALLSNDLIATGSIDMEELTKAGKKAFWIDLAFRGETVGSLLLESNFVPTMGTHVGIKHPSQAQVSSRSELPPLPQNKRQVTPTMTTRNVQKARLDLLNSEDRANAMKKRDASLSKNAGQVGSSYNSISSQDSAKNISVQSEPKKAVNNGPARGGIRHNSAKLENKVLKDTPLLKPDGTPLISPYAKRILRPLVIKNNVANGAENPTPNSIKITALKSPTNASAQTKVPTKSPGLGSAGINKRFVSQVKNMPPIKVGSEQRLSFPTNSSTDFPSQLTTNEDRFGSNAKKLPANRQSFASNEDSSIQDSGRQSKRVRIKRVIKRVLRPQKPAEENQITGIPEISRKSSFKDQVKQYITEKIEKYEGLDIIDKQAQTGQFGGLPQTRAPVKSDSRTQNVITVHKPLSEMPIVKSRNEQYGQNKPASRITEEKLPKLNKLATFGMEPQDEWKLALAEDSEDIDVIVKPEKKKKVLFADQHEARNSHNLHQLNTESSIADSQDNSENYRSKGYETFGPKDTEDEVLFASGVNQRQYNHSNIIHEVAVGREETGLQFD